MSIPIPQPWAMPILGNVGDVDPTNFMESLKNLAARYGPIFKLNFIGKDQYFATDVDLISELCDEKRFHKSVSGGLEELRAGAADGLFTAYHGEPGWGVAHRILVPAFGPLNIHHMFDEMKDIAVQLVQKWARTSDRICVTDDYTRLTLDSIALTAMDLRFNSFYTEKMHPFIDAMVSFLVEAGVRETKTKVELLLRRSKNRRYQQDISYMRQVCCDVIAQRRAHPVEKKDLLNVMLHGKDPKTGEGMSDESIINNILTLLVAGHETTSGMLSFTTYFLLKNPAALRKAQAEVDRVVGTGTVKFEHLSKLPYLEAVLRESLRLQPTAPAFSVETHGESEVLGGKYLIPPGKPVHCLLSVSGRDPAVYGSDANEFKPERMLGEEFAKLPVGAWKPFGNGARGCIGRPFAWQEALLALTMILQNFDMRFDDPSYQLHIKETLTVKPDDFYMRVRLRNGVGPMDLERKLFGVSEPTLQQDSSNLKARPVSRAGSKKPILVLYGSNSGTCEGLAYSFASSAAAHEFEAKVQPMDEMVNHLPRDRPVVFITASYEGAAPDNATAFLEWIENGSPTFESLQYSVFGCGHRDWFSTYQKVPKIIDSQLEAKGAHRLAARGETDVASGTIMNDFDQWQDEVFWPTLVDDKSVNCQDPLDVQISTTARASHLNYNVHDAIVISNDLVTAEGSTEKRHMELMLPTKLVYQAGDYLAVLPMNDSRLIARVLRHFNMPWDAVMTVQGSSHSFIPQHTEIPVSTVLASYVELDTPATHKNINTLATYNLDTPIKDTLVNGQKKERESRSVLDILEANPSIKVSFGVFLSLLTPMRIRQYSISSSPLKDPTKASITFSLANKDPGHPGVATHYLKSLQPGAKINMMVKKSHSAFHLPLNDKTPVIMACAGSGIAPFRGFIQERVAKIGHTGKAPGPALLFIGCRHPRMDMLFKEELDTAETLGAVKVFYAFSQNKGKSEGCRYVQDRIWRERAEVKQLFDQGAQVYICGSSEMGKGIRDVVTRVVIESDAREGKYCSSEEALEWWDSLRNERYAVDVFD